jgi:hypothetical protein
MTVLCLVFAFLECDKAYYLCFLKMKVNKHSSAYFLFMR